MVCVCAIDQDLLAEMAFIKVISVWRKLLMRTKKYWIISVYLLEPNVSEKSRNAQNSYSDPYISFFLSGQKKIILSIQWPVSFGYHNTVFVAYPIDSVFIASKCKTWK